MKLAVTGATGFVGSHLVDAAVAAGHQVSALTRRPQPPRARVDWIEGTLDRPDALARLCEGTDAVVHVAGVINGDEAAFTAGNVHGTEAVVAAAAAAGVPRFVHISSLAARHPALSAYGRSKCLSEEPVIAAGGAWTIIRPPAIYGPRDREMLELFRLARRFRAVPLPPGGRLSVIHVADLSALVLACLGSAMAECRTYEPDDGREGGWPIAGFARAVGDAVDRRVLPVPLPRRLLLAGAALDGLVRRDKAKLTRDRVAYFCHPDWAAAVHARPPAELWRPAIPTAEGLRATAAWYRGEGWL